MLVGILCVQVSDFMCTLLRDNVCTKECEIILPFKVFVLDIYLYCCRHKGKIYPKPIIKCYSILCRYFTLIM